MQFINKDTVKILLSPLMSFLRKHDYQGAQRPSILISNSKNVQKRIRKYYKRKSIVIYPPVKLPKSENKTTSKNYYLFFSSLVKQKGAELAVKTFNSLKKPLVVVGTGPRKTYLKRLAKDNIKFKGFIPERDKGKIYAGAKALIYCSIEEDFGIIPVEAMAHGVPVIAYKSGGVSETVVDGKTGLLFNKYSIEDLQRAIAKFEGMKFSSSACRNQAMQFSEEIFSNKLRKLVTSQFLSN
jgi:glycosyltransferase involved in cell wall biosynthesis